MSVMNTLGPGTKSHVHLSTPHIVIINLPVIMVVAAVHTFILTFWYEGAYIGAYN